MLVEMGIYASTTVARFYATATGYLLPTLTIFPFYSEHMVFDSLRKWAYDRRRGLLSTAAVVGGTYLAGHYALRKLEELREQLVEDKTAKEK